MPRLWVNRLLAEPSVAATDEVIQCYAPWTIPRRGNVLTILVGVNLDETRLGPAGMMTSEQRLLLTELGSVIVDESDTEQLGVLSAGQTAEMFGQRVRVVGFTHGIGSVTGPYVICSLETARLLLRPVGYDSEMTTFLLARCRTSEQTAELVSSLNRHGGMSTYAADDFSRMSRMYWLTTTKAGIAIGFITLLGLIIGALVTAQTLYSATLGLARELALLRALGAPLARLIRFVLLQAAVIGVTGVVLGLIMMEALFQIAKQFDSHPYTDWRLRLGSAGLAILMALGSGIFALISLRRTEPIQLLR